MAHCWLQHVQNTGGPYSDSLDSPHYDPDADSPHDPVSCRVRRLISQMPMSQRMTLSLVDVARLSYRETAAVMNIGLLDVQYHVVTARHQLLKEMQLDNEQRACSGLPETAESC
jgi:DNA-directed RNA polymerase specialized sigma24 family protein